VFLDLLHNDWSALRYITSYNGFFKTLAAHFKQFCSFF